MRSRKKVEAENFRNASEFHSKQFHFLDAQIVELRPELSVKLTGRELPKCV